MNKWLDFLLCLLITILFGTLIWGLFVLAAWVIDQLASCRFCVGAVLGFLSVCALVILWELWGLHRGQNGIDGP